jgi:hypothetical protein
MKIRRNVLFAIPVIFAILISAGCGSSSNTAAANNKSNALMVTMGDATNDSVIAFALTINSMTLTGGSNPTVISAPTRIEFVRSAGTFQPLVLAQIPSGTYTGATITVASPQVVIDTTTRQPVQLTAALSNSTVNVIFNTPLTIGGSSAETDFDLDLANSVTINGTTATINPTFHVSATNAQNRELDDVRGVVTSVSAPNFTLTSFQMAQAITFTTDANTKFRGITGLSQLANGMIIEVDAVTQSDGTVLAKRVEADVETDNGEELEGLITTVTGTPATQISLTTQFESSPVAALLNLLGVGDTVNVQISSTTVFKVADADHVDLTGSSLAFDANNIAAGQRVEADSDSESDEQHDSSGSGNSTTGNRIRLQQQELKGTISNLNGTTFTLTVAGDSAFALLSGKTTVNVQLQNNTNNEVTPANGANIRVRGLLFFTGSSSSYTMVASDVKQQ